MNIHTETATASVNHVRLVYNHVVREYCNRNIIYEVHSHFPKEGQAAKDVLFELSARKLKDASLPLAQEGEG
jgi:hypothetical protein